MTRPYSDSTLDALAAARKYGAPSSHDPLTLWRAAAFAEPPSRLHQSSDDAAIGLELAEQLARYIDGTAGHFPVHDALLAWDRICRRRHRDWPDHRGRPVCSEMVRLVIFGGASVNYVAERYEVTYPRAERLLRGAASFMRRKQEAWLAQAEPTLKARHDPDTCHDCIFSDPIRRRAHDTMACPDCDQHRRLWARTDAGIHDLATCLICRWAAA